MNHSAAMTRRDFLQRSTAAASGFAVTMAMAETGAPFQATGIRAGEVTDTSAIVWTRLTRNATRNNHGTVIPKPVKNGKKTVGGGKAATAVSVPVEQIEGACPGKAGRVRLRYSLKADLSDATTTPWAEVGADDDFIHQFQLTGLKPGSTYHYTSEAAVSGSETVAHHLEGRFHTAPAATVPGAFRFCVMTCQGYTDRDHPDGHPIYPAMLALDPKFVTMTGDLVYYDNDAPRAVSPALARLHWERMFSLPRLLAMMGSTSSYWLKDDHDTLANDTWPGLKAGELTFAEGQHIFHQQAPLGASSYRTHRWGRDLQIWFTDGRDFRSPNKMPDGPEKTIWGADQKEWFKRTVKDSTATWKLLISPTPLVGPDRQGKNDNHSNEGFRHEGDELRTWIKENAPDNFFVVCGDRHWQYHSVHPTSGVQEFSVGAASDSHAGGTPGEDRNYHRFHRVKGGFLCVELRPEGSQSTIAFQLRDVDGKVVHEATFHRQANA